MPQRSAATRKASPHAWGCVSGEDVVRVGIDVSEHQAGFDFSAAPLDFAILRTTDGTYQDTAFEQLLIDATRAGLDVSTYHYLRAPSEGTTVTEQVTAALSLLDGLRFPMWIDVESRAGLSLEDVRACHAAFLSAGVEVAGIYTTASYWRRHMRSGLGGLRMADPAQFGNLWLADWGTNPTVDLAASPELPTTWPRPLGFPEPALWQFTSRGRIGGVEVDLNLAI